MNFKKVENFNPFILFKKIACSAISGLKVGNSSLFCSCFLFVPTASTLAVVPAVEELVNIKIYFNHARSWSNIVQTLNSKQNGFLVRLLRGSPWVLEVGLFVGSDYEDFLLQRFPVGLIC